MRPSVVTIINVSPPRARVEYMSQRPLGEKLGDSSWPVSVSRVSLLPPASSRMATKKLAVAARHVGELLAVGTDPRRDVVVGAERHARGRAAARRHPVDLRRPAAIGREVDRLAIRREHGLGIDAARLRQPLRLAALRRDHVDLRAAVARQRDRQTACRRATRPGRCCCRGTRRRRALACRAARGRRPRACASRTRRRRDACRRATRHVPRARARGCVASPPRCATGTASGPATGSRSSPPTAPSGSSRSGRRSASGAIAVGLNGWWVGPEIRYGIEDSRPEGAGRRRASGSPGSRAPIPGSRRS